MKHIKRVHMPPTQQQRTTERSSLASSKGRLEFAEASFLEKPDAATLAMYRLASGVSSSTTSEDEKLFVREQLIELAGAIRRRLRMPKILSRYATNRVPSLSAQRKQQLFNRTNTLLALQASFIRY
jgi:hypothetical protein